MRALRVTPANFRRLLLAVTILAAIPQLAFVAARWQEPMYDALKYSSDAGLLAEGRGFIGSEALYFDATVRQSAIHPPLTSMWLAIPGLAGYSTLGYHQLWMVLPGMGVVLVAGLIGRRVGGEVAGLVAAVLAGLHPGVWSFPATVMAETPSQFAWALCLLASYRYLGRPTRLGIGMVSGACALAVLSRSEFLIAAAVLIVGLIVGNRMASNRDRLVHLAVAGVWAGVLVGPWVGFNLLRFEKPVTIASGLDLAAVSSCDSQGYWFLWCRPLLPERHESGRPLDESEESAMYRQVVIDRMSEDWGDYPAMVVARLQRSLTVTTDPARMAAREGRNEGRGEDLVLWGITYYWLTVPIAAVGAQRLRKAGVEVWPLVAPCLVSIVVPALVVHGTTRYRIGLDLGLVVLAAAAFDHAGLANRVAGGLTAGADG